MKLSGIVVSFCMGILGGATAFGANDELLDLPLGHLEFKDGLNDEVCVVARCVPTEDLLKAIAERIGETVEFTSPVRTYATINERGSRTLVRWMDRAVLHGGSVACRHEGSKWVVGQRGISKEFFDASLTDEEIIKNFTRPKLKLKQPAGGVNTGILIFDGQFVPPPYQVECVATQDGFGVSVNGVLIERVQLSKRSALPPPPPLPESGQFTAYKELQMYIVFRFYPDLVSKLDAEAAHRKTVELLKTQSIVEEVEDGETISHIRVWLKGQRAAGNKTVADTVFPTNYDPRTGAIVDLSPAYLHDSTLLRAEVEKKADMRRKWFEEGQVDICGTHGGSVSFRHGTVRYFAGVCALAANVPVRQAECLMREVVEDPTMAREMAVNLRPDFKALHDALMANLPPEPAR